MNYLSKIPNWVITIILAALTTYVTLMLNVKTLESKVEFQQQRIESLEKNKLDNSVYSENAKRLDRIESKLDRLIEKK